MDADNVHDADGQITLVYSQCRNVVDCVLRTDMDGLARPTRTEVLEDCAAHSCEVSLGRKGSNKRLNLHSLS